MFMSMVNRLEQQGLNRNQDGIIARTDEHADAAIKRRGELQERLATRRDTGTQLS